MKVCQERKYQYQQPTLNTHVTHITLYVRTHNTWTTPGHVHLWSTWTRLHTGVSHVGIN